MLDCALARLPQAFLKQRFIHIGPMCRPLVCRVIISDEMKLAALFLAALGCAQAQVVPAKDRTVVVISIDGLAASAWKDPRFPAPNMRLLAREGVIANGMVPPNPTVTWPSHTTMMTGAPPSVHGVLYNGLPVRGGDRAPLKVEPWRPKQELVQTETLYDKFHAAGMTTAQVDWVAIYNAPTVTWQFAEVPDPNGPIEKEMIAAGLVTVDEVKTFNRGNPAWRDQIWTQAGVHILKRHKPNLLLFHLLNTDSLNHAAGPRTAASWAGYALADFYVGQILDAIKAAGLSGRTTVFLVSDHGFKTARRIIKPNAILREMGLHRETNGKVECDVHVIPEGGTAMVYFTNPARKGELAAQIAEKFRGVEGVGSVIEPKEFEALGYPHPDRNSRMADLVLAAKDGYAFSGSAAGAPLVNWPEGGNPGNHGYLNTDPEMEATFVAWGYGVRRGVQLGVISANDVAPTIARLSGLTLPLAKGKVLSEVLANDLYKKP
ncbi:MAG: alkaline phosphatase family protein [Acidobacteria bacterium]|nr:alkaline phosphatase family protein [Acidobacteriota bacterium]